MIEHYLSFLEQYLQHHPHIGILFAFLIALAESLPLIGTIIPGSLTMTVIGVFVGRGMLPTFQTLLVATLGALLGDSIGFWFGKYYNVHLRCMWPFKKYPHLLTKGEAFFEKHGGKSILIGRFIGPARSSVPLIAGFLKMNAIRFFLAAIPSSLFWAIAYLFPGILVGAASLTLPPGLTTKFVLGSLLIIILLWCVFWLIQRFFSFLALTINRWIDCFWSWLYHHHSAKFLTWITNRHRPTDHHQLTLLILACISFFFFSIFMIITLLLGPSTNFNAAPFYLLQGLRFPLLDKFFVAITLLGATPTVFMIAWSSAIVLALQKQWRAAYYLIGICVVSAAAIYFFKTVIPSPRPTGFLSVIKSSSFPSGHTCLSLTVFGFIAFLMAQQMPRRWRPIPYTIVGIIIVLICISRLYLGAHWLEDVLASIFLGFSILLLLAMFYRRYLPELWAHTTLLILLSLLMILPWIGFSIFEFKKTMYYSSPEWTTQPIAFNKWWENPTQYVPIYRLNRLGHPTQPLNIQWAEYLERIQKKLLDQGWLVVHQDHNLQKTLGRFVSHMPEKRLPLLPWLYEQQPPVLFMIKRLPQQTTILELRLWTSHIAFTDTPMPLWVGSLNYHLPKKHLLSLKKTQEILFEKKGAITEKLFKVFGNCPWKIIQTPLFAQPEKIRALQWSGSILVTSCHPQTGNDHKQKSAEIFYNATEPDTR